MAADWHCIFRKAEVGTGGWVKPSQHAVGESIISAFGIKRLMNRKDSKRSRPHLHSPQLIQSALAVDVPRAPPTPSWPGLTRREQHVLQRGGPEDAAVQVGEDGGEIGGAEACRDGRECGGGGAMADGGEEMSAVAEQDADGVEDEGDVLGHGVAGLILGWKLL
jgi:hypothetical protein